MITRNSQQFRYKHFVPASQDLPSQARFSGLSGTEVGLFYQNLISTVSTEPEADQKSPVNRFTVKNQRPKTISIENPKPANVSVGYFFQCAQNGNVDGLRHCYQQGLEIDAKDGYGWTALMCASASGALKAAEFLLAHGASRKVMDKSGVTALSLAHRNGHSEVVKLLLDSQVPDVMVKTEKTETENLRAKSHYCNSCKATIRDSTPEQHRSSTVHQFSTRKTRSGTAGSRYHIPESNIGFRIMVKDGWKTDDGLGPSGAGAKYPPKTVLKRDREGLGSESKAKARVTHFGPRDVTAVKYHRRTKTLTQTGITKRDRCRKERKDKQLEISFRREWNSFDS